MFPSITGVRQSDTAWPNLESISTLDLKPYANNARIHSQKQIRQIARSIERFGFNHPVLIADDNMIIAGHGRVAAAQSLGIETVPALRLSHLSQEERRAYILADNRLAESAGWDTDILAIELQGLIDLDFDVELTGFPLAEIDLVLGDAEPASTNSTEDAVPQMPSGPALTQVGDLWHLGEHRLMCGDARQKEDVAILMGDASAGMIFTDPPYNVAIDGHVSGLGKNKHREFACASGEMSVDAFTRFLTQSLGAAAHALRDGGIAFVCMDWRHMEELLKAGKTAFTELKNVCVWNKTNAGMGTFYRSKHELVFVYKLGTSPHVNSFGLGDTGRYRTNVWDYAGANVVGADRDADLAMHPTVKPVAMIRDAIKDCSRRGDVILDVFAGSGSTLIAAHGCGRKANLLEFDPLYCDTILRRYRDLTGEDPVHAVSGAEFSELETSAHGLEANQ